MNDNLDDIDDLFTSSFEGYEETPSVNVWDAIDQDLENRNHSSLKLKYNNLKKLTAILSLFTISSIAYHFIAGQTNNKIGVEDSSVVIKKDAHQVIEQPNTAAVNLPLNLKNITDTILSERMEVKSIGTDMKINKTPLFLRTDKILIDRNNSKISDLTSNIDPIDKVQMVEKKYYVDELMLPIKNETLITGTDQNNTLSFKKNLINNVRMVKESTIAEPVLLSYKSVPESDTAFKISAITFNHLLNSNNIATIKKGSISGKNKFSLAVFISPETAFNRLEDDKPDGNRGYGQNRRPDDRHKIKEEESTTRSLTGGLLLAYQLNKRISIQSGITFINKTAQNDPKKVFAELDNGGKIQYKYNCSFGSTYISPKLSNAPVVGDSAIANASNNSLFYVGIPFNISYHFSVGKFQLSPTIGSAINFLIKQHITTGIQDFSGSQKQYNNTINGLKPTYINANLGFDIQYYLSKKLAITAMPSATIAVNAVNANEAVRSYPNTFGVRLGFKMNL